MPREASAKPITIRLGPDFRAALEHFKKNDPRHLSIKEQVQRGLIFYWIRQPLPTNIDTLNLVMPGWEEGDEAFGIVPEEVPNGDA